MEDRIKLLPESISNQIAAGEVVNRPSSVVKEMVENSIDAGATEVIINFRKGGHELIQIVDNGRGMSPNDARMAFEKHATSKINQAQDIYALHTFGFRGEALASISAVAQVELKSRMHDAEIGTQTIINGGQFVEQQPIMCEAGSQFFVRNLFFNTPARRKFMDKVTTCSNQIKTEFRRLAICYPTISFELHSDDSLVYRLRTASLAERIVDVVGRSIKSNLLPVSAKTSIVNIEGHIGRPEAAKKSSLEQYLFVNGRFFKSPYLNKAITRAYEKIIPAGLNPSFFIFLTVDPSDVDVNIHPQKTEVRFVDEEGVWQMLHAAVRETLARTNSVPMIDFEQPREIDIPTPKAGVQYAEPKTTTQRGYNPFVAEYTNYNETTNSPARESVWQQKTKDNSRGALIHTTPNSEWEVGFEELYESKSFIEIESSSNDETEEWQTLPFEDIVSKEVNEKRAQEIDRLMMMGDRYAWCKIDGSYMSVVDLTRAKEQLLFSHYMNTLKRGESVSQTILFPIELQLSESEFSLMEENIIDFAALGFNIVSKSGGKIEVTGLPSDVTTENADQVIYELLQILTTPEDLVEERRRSLAATLAYNASHGKSQGYTEQDAREIISQLLLGGELGRTPSGKAIVCNITKEEVKQRLG